MLTKERTFKDNEIGGQPVNEFYHSNSIDMLWSVRENINLF